MFTAIAESLAVLLLLIAIAMGLRRSGVISQDDGATLARLVTDLVLPALVFASLSRHALEWQRLMPGLTMLATTLILLLVAWWVGRKLGLKARQLGAFILVAGIGSSSTLGYTLVGQVFPGDMEAAFAAVMVGEIGVILPLFLVGVPVAIHFGDQDQTAGAHKRELVRFLKSPLFIALVSGLAVSSLPLPENSIKTVVFRALDILGAALPVFVALSIGLMLRPVSIRKIGAVIVAVLTIKLLLEPLMVLELATLEHMNHLEKNVLVIEAAMPSGTLAAIIATRYGCDGGLASVLVVVSYVASLLSIPLVAILASM